MSESDKHSGEHQAKAEKIDLTAESRKNIERIREKAENAAEASHEEIHSLKSKAESHAISGKEYSPGENESTAHGSHHYVNQKELKADSYRRSLKQVRSKLSTSEKALSKVVHNKTVENISELGSSTIARPSGILGGGICALAGSSFLLYMTKHYGYEYNYLVFFLLFIGGFFIGMLVELLLRFLLKKS